MSPNAIQETINALDALLDDEREALLAGSLDQISQMHERKVELIDKLNALDVADRARLEGLRTKVGRNQDLLSSAAEGIRAVAQRLAAVRSVRQKLETYDEKGQRKAIQTRPDGTLEKRA